MKTSPGIVQGDNDNACQRSKGSEHMITTIKN